MINNQSQITPEMAKMELARRQAARAELARRQSDAPQQQMQPQETGLGSLIQSINQSVPAQAMLGAGDELANSLSLGLLHPQTGKGAAYNVGKLGAEVAEYAPIGVGVAKLGIKAFSPLARGLAEKLTAKQAASDLMQHIGEGKGLEETGKGLAKGISDAFKQEKFESNPQFKVLDKLVGDQSIYGQTPLATGEEGIMQGNKLYPDLISQNEEMANKIFKPSIKLMHEDFIKEPTYIKARNLESQVSKEIMKLTTKEKRLGALDAADDARRDSYQFAKDALSGDISSFLKSKNPALDTLYKQGKLNWAQNVGPFYSDPRLAKIAGEAVTNPKNITNVLANPSSEISNIIENMGSKAKNQIIYRELGKITNKTPENILKGIYDLDKKGLSSYMTDEVRGLAGQLEQKLGKAATYKRTLKYGIPAAAAVGIGGTSMLKHLLGGL